MKKKLCIVIFFVIVFGLPCKLFAQLEGKDIYIYLRGDKLHMTLYCTNETPHISDLGAAYCDAGGMKYLRINPKPPRTRAYWGTTGYKGVYEFKFITFYDHDPREFGERCSKQTWYFYESLNIITQISPSEINDKRDDIINDPWKYGEKAVYDKIYSEEELKAQAEQRQKNKEEYNRAKEEILQEFEKYTYLYTQNEVGEIRANINHYSYSEIQSLRKEIKGREKIYELVNQHSELFSSDYYYEVITKYKDLKMAERIINDSIGKSENFNRLIGEWTTEKGKRSVCTITSRNNQLFMTLKYNGDIIYEGSITEGIREEKNIKGGRIYNQVYSSITADNITIYLNVINEVFTSTQSRGGYWVTVGGHTTKYHLSYENGTFVLDVTKDGKKEDSVTFRKNESK